MKKKLSEQTLDVFFIIATGFKKQRGALGLINYWQHEIGLIFEEKEYVDVALYLLRDAFKELLDCSEHPSTLYNYYVEGLDTFRRWKSFPIYKDENKSFFGEEVYAIIHAMHFIKIRKKRKINLVCVNGFSTKLIKETKRRLKSKETEVKKK